MSPLVIAALVGLALGFILKPKALIIVSLVVCIVAGVLIAREPGGSSEARAWFFFACVIYGGVFFIAAYITCFLRSPMFKRILNAVKNTKE